MNKSWIVRDSRFFFSSHRAYLYCRHFYSDLILHLRVLGSVALLWHYTLKWSVKKNLQFFFKVYVIVLTAISRKIWKWHFWFLHFRFLHFAKCESKAMLPYFSFSTDNHIYPWIWWRQCSWSCRIIIIKLDCPWYGANTFSFSFPY